MIILRGTTRRSSLNEATENISLKDILVAMKNSKQVDITFQSKSLKGGLSNVGVSREGTFFENRTGFFTWNHSNILRIVQDMDLSVLSSFEIYHKDGMVVTVTLRS
jgi:hypothetical protein